MTTWENTDSLDNVTVTSDEAFERVTSNIKDEYTDSDGSLKQNTAWLINEIPNISILDISDFLIENKKTLYDRQNWNIVVGKAGRSIEAQPQDTVTLKLSSDYILTFWAVHFDEWVSSLNYTVCKVDSVDTYKVNILADWYYRISYGWTVDPQNAHILQIWVFSTNQWWVTADVFDWWPFPWQMSWWRTIWNVLLHKWDYIFMDVIADDDVVVKQSFTYLEVSYQQPTL